VELAAFLALGTLGSPARRLALGPLVQLVFDTIQRDAQHFGDVSRAVTAFVHEHHVCALVTLPPMGIDARRPGSLGGAGNDYAHGFPFLVITSPSSPVTGPRLAAAGG
jgi:hypothetical protein